MEVKSSGSTGEAKLIQIKKKHMLVSAQKTIDFFQLKENDTCLLSLSTSTIGGKMMLVRAVLAKMSILVSKVASDALLELTQKVDFAALVPLQLDFQLKEDPSKLQFIKHVIVGGAPIATSTISLLKENQMTVYQTFGMTETISHVALKKVGFEQEEFYRGLENISFTSENKQLIINYPEIELYSLKTNDLVKLHGTHQFKWLGRADFVINSGGLKFVPEELEAKLSSFIHVPFFIHGIADEKLGQKIVLFVEGESNCTLDDLKPFLEKYEVPKEIRILTNFIRTQGGKINRLASAARH
ncbi:MAG: AMP-binding protein [Bacteroidota bacterium]